MSEAPLRITSLTNARVKRAVKLRQRSHRDALKLLLVEGYREVKRAIDNGHMPTELFVCPDLFQGSNERSLIACCAEHGTHVLDCSEPVFRKIAYRDRPEGLLAVVAQVEGRLNDLELPERPLLVVAEAIEKPGNLGTIIRTADAAGADAVMVCDRCTDINNPNVVRASIGTLFAVPVIETTTDELLPWLRGHKVSLVATTPHTDLLHTDADLSGAVALILGTEQVGLSDRWMREADIKVRIPMHGQADSLNVAAAATIVLYEAVRQRR